MTAPVRPRSTITGILCGYAVTSKGNFRPVRFE